MSKFKAKFNWRSKPNSIGWNWCQYWTSCCCHTTCCHHTTTCGLTATNLDLFDAFAFNFADALLHNATANFFNLAAVASISILRKRKHQRRYHRQTQKLLHQQNSYSRCERLDTHWANRPARSLHEKINLSSLFLLY